MEGGTEMSWRKLVDPVPGTGYPLRPGYPPAPPVPPVRDDNAGDIDSNGSSLTLDVTVDGKPASLGNCYAGKSADESLKRLQELQLEQTYRRFVTPRFLPGDKVAIGGYIEGLVDMVKIEGVDHKTYRVRWWHNGELKSDLFEEYELRVSRQK